MKMQRKLKQIFASFLALIMTVSLASGFTLDASAQFAEENTTSFTMSIKEGNSNANNYNSVIAQMDTTIEIVDESGTRLDSNGRTITSPTITYETFKDITLSVSGNSAGGHEFTLQTIADECGGLPKYLISTDNDGNSKVYEYAEELTLKSGDTYVNTNTISFNTTEAKTDALAAWDYKTALSWSQINGLTQKASNEFSGLTLKAVYKEYSVKDSASYIETAGKNKTGATITLFDYSENINKTLESVHTTNNSFLRFWETRKYATGYQALERSSTTGGYFHGTVAPTLLNGYPNLLSDFNSTIPAGSLTVNGVNTGTLGVLFGTVENENVISYNADYLLKESGNGYFEYDSAKNAADYDPVTERFYVRENSEVCQYTAPGSDFLPFNYSNGSTTTYTTGSKTYNVPTSEVNYWLGMSMELEFIQPKDGQVNGEDMVFSFTGDDDVWVFIDDVLVLDMAGTHGATSGTINFATGEVTYSNESKYVGTAPATIKACYTTADAEENAAGGFDGETLTEYTKHTLKYFYFERGAGSSNCHIKFNLQTIPTNSVTIEKSVEDFYDTVSADQDYKMRLWVKQAGETEYSVWTDRSKSTVELDDEGYFTLKDTESAQFAVPLGSTYYIEEYDTAGYAVSYKYNSNDATAANLSGTTAKSEIYNVDENENNILVNNKVSLTDITGSKTWVDADNQDGVRPNKITINLLADGNKVASKTVSAADKWTWTFEDMPIYNADGTVIEYTVAEDAVDDYGTIINGYNVTNTHTPVQIDISGNKTWNDADDQDGIRPESITINLLADGVKIDSVTVTEEDDWKWSFTGLDKYRDHGTEIIYTITEETVDGYETVVDGFNVTNSYTPAVTEVLGEKTWNDADNQDGIRPESITINLLADGEVIDSKSVTADDAWSWSFTSLPKYRDHGTEIVYTITEDSVEGYETTIDGYDVTNTHTPAVVSVAGSKTWNDADDQDGIRPESITINLLADGEVIDTIEVTEADDWSWSFTDLPKYRDQGTEIIYTVTEDAVAGYETTIDGYDVTNTHTPAVVSVAGNKTWDDADDQDGIRPESITINLLADGEVIDTVEVTEADDWSWSFTDLPKYKDHGTEIVYTITEEVVDGYETTIDGYDVTNTYVPEVIEVAGSKTWDDADDKDKIRPESITINLLADGEVIETVKVTKADDWSWTFTDLPKYKNHGTEIVYTITEDAVDGYTTVIDGYNVTNTHTPTPKTGDGSHAGLWFTLAVLALGTIVVVKRRRFA